MNNRTEAKLTDLSGMQKGIEGILKQAWERGRKYGQNEAIDNAPTADDWQKYSDELWKNAYERGKADAYEKAKQKVTVSVKVGNETVETIEINGDAVRWSSSSL